MTFQPVVPFGGNAGWSFLQRSRETLQTVFENSGLQQRSSDYFRENIGKVTSAEDLVNDRRLLTVALGAFGLDDDINNRFFITKVLESDVENDTGLAARLSDKRYAALAEAFGLGTETPPRLDDPAFVDRILGQFQDRQFEVAIGNQDPDLRLALGFQRELEDLTSRTASEDAQWFSVMATPPLRAVFEDAFRLPTEFGILPVDRQLEIFKSRAEAFFGDTSVSQFLEPENQEKLTRQFLATSEVQAFSQQTSRGALVLSLLQSSPIRF